MYKLSVFIYLNRVSFDARQKSYEFKSLVNFGTSQKNFKIPLRQCFFFHVKNTILYVKKIEKSAREKEKLLRENKK